MKICSTIFASIVLILMLSPLSAYAEVGEKPFSEQYYVLEDVPLSNSPVALENARFNKNSIKLQSQMNFMIFDSLANVYSYGNIMSNKAIKYEPVSGKLITVKRGFIDNDRYPSYSGDNTKNNLFLRISGDWGATWQDPINIYNQASIMLNEARYPSVFPFQYEGELTVATNVPRVIEKQSTWPGHFFGFWNQTFGAVAIGHSLAVAGKQNLEWGVASRLLADEFGDGSFYHFAVGRISSTNNEDVENANHLGWKRTEDLNDIIEQNIPDQWASNKFRTANPGFRTNEIVDLLKDNDGHYYFGVFGGFVSTANSKNSFGISKSSDKGETWTEFDVLPWQLVDNYITSKGHPADSANFLFHNKGFTVYQADGTTHCSFAAKLHAWGTGSTEIYLIELVYSYGSNSWTINEIYSGTTGSYILYQDILDGNSQRTNWNDIELDITRTVDGQHLLVKWIDLIGYDPGNNTFTTTDIFVSARSINTTRWTQPQNVSNSAELDRMTMLPDVIPNDLMNIPIFKMITMTAPGMTEQEVYQEQFYGGKDQYLAVGHFNFVVGIKDEEEPCCTKIEIRQLYPNPNSGDGIINAEFFMPEENYVAISIYDATGKMVKELNHLDDVYKFGLNPIQIDLTDSPLPIGSYYLNMIGGGQKATKMFSVIR